MTSDFSDDARKIDQSIQAIYGSLSMWSGRTDGDLPELTDEDHPLPVQVLSAPVAVAGYGGVPVVIQRPNDTTGYTAGDVTGSVSGSAVIAFPNMAPSTGGWLMLTSAKLQRDVVALISGETTYSLYLYSAPPPSGLADNAVFDIAVADRACYLGKINLGTPVDEVSTLAIEVDGINKQIYLPGPTLYGYLVTVGAYAPVAMSIIRLTLSAVGL